MLFKLFPMTEFVTLKTKNVCFWQHFTPLSTVMATHFSHQSLLLSSVKLSLGVQHQEECAVSKASGQNAVNKRANTKCCTSII